MREKNRATACVWAACLLAVIAVFATGVLNRGKIWPDVPLDFADARSERRIGDGDAYGVMSGGPYYDLMPGVYRIKWQIDGDGDNRIHLQCSNDAQIVPAVIDTQAGVFEDEAVFEVKEPAHSFSIAVEFASGTQMQVYNIRLYTPEYTDHAFSFAALAILLALCMTAQLRGWWTPRRVQTAIVLALCALLVSAAYLQEDHVSGIDTQFHAARLCNLADGLQSGQFPVRAGGFSYNGYGALTSVFYPDALLYPFALMLLGGASVAYALNAAAIAIHAATAALSYASFKRLLGDRQQALCAAVVYVLSMHRMTGMYWRYAQGEMLAMAFLPLFVLALYELLWRDSARWPLLAVSATLIFNSHVVTTVLCALLAAGCCALRLPALVRQRRFVPLFKACALTLLLGAHRLVPMLTSYLTGVTTSVNQLDFGYTALSVSELLGSIDGMGASLIFGAAAFAFTAAETRREEDGAGWLCLFGGAACMVLSTELIPWDHVVKVMPVLASALQFPWRFQVLGTVLLAACAGAGFARLFGGSRAGLMTLILAALCVLPFEQAMHPDQTPLAFGQGANAYMAYPEYQLADTDIHQTRSREVVLDGDVRLTQYVKDGTRVTAQVEAEGGGTVSLPLFGFDGYAATLDGAPIAWMRGENNRLTVSLPAGASGTLRVWFAGKGVWRAADTVSLIAAAGMVICRMHNTRMRKKREQA